MVVKMGDLATRMKTFQELFGKAGDPPFMDAQMGTVLVHGIREAYGRYAKKEHICIVKIVSH